MSKELSTKDVCEAAFLWCQDGIDFLRVERQKGKRRPIIFFYFGADEAIDLSLLRRDYFNDNTLVEPKAFMQKLENIKNILHSSLSMDDKET